MTKLTLTQIRIIIALSEFGVLSLRTGMRLPGRASQTPKHRWALDGQTVSTQACEGLLDHEPKLLRFYRGRDAISYTAFYELTEAGMDIAVAEARKIGNQKVPPSSEGGTCQHEAD